MSQDSAAEGQPSYWQELLIQTLRLSGKVGVQLMRLSLSDMKDLLGVALCRELQDRGYRTSDMCVAVGVSRTTVKKYLRLSKQLGTLDLQPEALRLAVIRLKDGPVTVHELRRRLPQGDEFDTAEVALSLLNGRGLVQRYGEGDTATWGLTAAAEDLDAPEWEAPLADLSHLYWLGRDVIRRLNATREVPLGQLRRDLRLSRGDDILEKTLALLEELGYIELSQGRPPRYRLATSYVRMIPAEERARRRVGLLDLVEKTGQFLETMLIRDEGVPLGQRSFEFRARPEDMRQFLKEHKEWVVERLTQLEQDADAGDGGRPHMMVWAISPTGQSSTS